MKNLFSSGMARPGQRYPGQSPAENAENNKLMSKNKLQALAKDIDQASILEDDVMELLLKVSEDFIDNVVSGSCALAKHRRSQTLDVQGTESKFSFFRNNRLF